MKKKIHPMIQMKNQVIKMKKYNKIMATKMIKNKIVKIFKNKNKVINL